MLFNRINLVSTGDAPKTVNVNRTQTGKDIVESEEEIR